MKKKLLWPLLLSSAVLFGLGSAGNIRGAVHREG